MARFARRERISDATLRNAVQRADCGIVDADLGGGLIKQRVAREGKGRSSGYRMLLAYRRGDRAVFVYGFAKSERENMNADELLTLQEIGAGWLAADLAGLAKAIAEHALLEVYDDEDRATKPPGQGSA